MQVKYYATRLPTGTNGGISSCLHGGAPRNCKRAHATRCLV
jgi:hypothetical protein